MLLPQYRRTLAILLALVMTAGFIVMIPAYCPGFPTPRISQVQLSGVSPTGTGSLIFFVNASIVNDGTGGNVVIRTKLVNVSRNSIEGKSVKTLYMTGGEKRMFLTTVNGPAGAPCKIVVEAERKTAFTTGS